MAARRTLGSVTGPRRCARPTRAKVTHSSVGGRPKRAADDRERVADRRDERADQRDRSADRRERAADAREERADERDRAADARERAADARERVEAEARQDQQRIDSEVRMSFRSIGRG